MSGTNVRDDIADVARRIIEQDVTTLDVLAASSLSVANDWVGGGEVAAIDGSLASGVISLVDRDALNLVVAGVTSRTVVDPVYTRVQVSLPRFKKRPESLQEMIELLSESRNDSSWPSTIREYLEREFALDHFSDKEVVLIDGPVFTQNLSTQAEGRFLLDRIKAANFKTIGFIKSLIRTPIATAVGLALKPGEAWVHDQFISDTLSVRESGWTEKAVSWWKTLSDWVRVVYRINDRVFSIECRREDVSLACAILISDQSRMGLRELPMLLETADHLVRTMDNPHSATDYIAQTLTQSAANFLIEQPERDTRI